jgi:hypothetical protein
MKIRYGTQEFQHFPSVCPDIEIGLSDIVPYVKLIIGFDMYYIAPDAALDLAAVLQQAAGKIKENRGKNAPKS